jgi:3',5'-cyclic AMP phosphodiesterase CpdA
LSQDFTFIHVADIHVGTPRSFRFSPAWNDNWETARAQILELDPDFLLIGGDMTRDGSTHRFELEQVRNDLDALPFPVHCIPGNHEVGNKYQPDAPMAIRPEFLDRYESVFGPSEWSFDYEGTRFSGCNAFLLGSGLPDERLLRDWLTQQTRRETLPHHVWMIHPALFADSFDEADWDPGGDRRAWYFALDSEPRRFLWDIFRLTNTTAVISAHIHCRRHLRVDGIDLHFAPSTAFPQWKNRWPDGDPSLGFLIFHSSEGNLRHDFVPLRTTSRRKGYGPGGNPSLAERDYELAWERPALNPQIE